MDLSLPENHPIQKINKKRRVLVLLCAFIGLNAIVFGAFYFSVKSQKVENNADLYSNTKTQISQAPFAEMTIPYLRSRSYESSLSQLNQATETSNYIGYLTSYQSDGFKVKGYLTIPKGVMPSGGWPAIVFVHGYIPPASYRTLENYATHVDFLAKNGSRLQIESRVTPEERVPLDARVFGISM